MKKLLTLALLLLVITNVSGCRLFRRQQAEAEPTPKPAINEPVNVIPVTERPYLSLVPRNDGRELTLRLGELRKPATEMEYELEYQSGTLLQGAFGELDLTGTAPFSTEILLGSCSAGGSCSYHEDVTGGTITSKYRGEENYALKDEWRFQATADAEGMFSSRDGKFQLDAGTALNRSAYVIVMQTAGLPSEIEGELLAGPYGVFPSNGLPQTGSGELLIRLNEDSQTATILGWDGSEWVEFETSVDGREATATVDLLEVYVVTR